MKIRHHRKYEWWFWPPKDSLLRRERCYVFKYKSSLIKFIKANIYDTIGGTVALEHKCFNSSGAVRKYLVWYNEYEYHHKDVPFKVVLKKLDFRGSKYIFKPRPVSKANKKYFAFSDKVIRLMCKMSDGFTQSDVNRLITLFIKRGFKDFQPDEEDQDYIDYYKEKGIDFFHWSDRCDWLRTKTIIEYFKHLGFNVNL